MVTGQEENVKNCLIARSVPHATLIVKAVQCDGDKVSEKERNELKIQDCCLQDYSGRNN